MRMDKNRILFFLFFSCLEEKKKDINGYMIIYSHIGFNKICV